MIACELANVIIRFNKINGNQEVGRKEVIPHPTTGRPPEVHTNSAS